MTHQPPYAEQQYYIDRIAALEQQLVDFTEGTVNPPYVVGAPTSRGPANMGPLQPELATPPWSDRRPSVIRIGPIGSRYSDLECWFKSESPPSAPLAGPWVRTGCFSGLLSEFGLAVEAAHGANGGNEHAVMYRLVIKLLWELWDERQKRGASA